ncbi:18229_t:CDS:1, partial [Entrophospora sp. SA101]
MPCLKVQWINIIHSKSILSHTPLLLSENQFDVRKYDDELDGGYLLDVKDWNL